MFEILMNTMVGISAAKKETFPWKKIALMLFGIGMIIKAIVERRVTAKGLLIFSIVLFIGLIIGNCGDDA
jgi:hypothetical protein